MYICTQYTHEQIGSTSRHERALRKLLSERKLKLHVYVNMQMYEYTGISTSIHIQRTQEQLRYMNERYGKLLGERMLKSYNHENM